MKYFGSIKGYHHHHHHHHHHYNHLHRRHSFQNVLCFTLSGLLPICLFACLLTRGACF
jgi:hypothetical protein